MVVYAEAGVLLALLAEQLTEGQLPAHRGRGSSVDAVGRFLRAVRGLSLLGLAAGSCFVGNFHHLVACFDSAVGRRGGRRVGKDPDAVDDLVALQDDIRVADLHVVAASEVEVEVVEPAAVVYDDAVALDAHGRGGQLADEEGALNADLLPLLRLKVEGVQGSVRRDMLDCTQLWIDAPEHREVELLVGPRGREGHVDGGRCSVRLVVGRQGRRLRVAGAGLGFVRRHRDVAAVGMCGLSNVLHAAANKLSVPAEGSLGPGTAIRRTGGGSHSAVAMDHRHC